MTGVKEPEQSRLLLREMRPTVVSGCRHADARGLEQGRTISLRAVVGLKPGKPTNLAALREIVSTLLYSSRLYAQNPVFGIVHEESVKVYLHMYNGNLIRTLVCIETCVAKELPILFG